MQPLVFAYYCSGHGYGHATRVSAVATWLRQLDDTPTVYIVSSAPQHVFDLAIAAGSHYRSAEIDPVIVQPLAYYVDRRKSVDELKQFISKQQRKLEEEVRWLKDNGVDCVLSDAAFLACKAANMAHIPSALITNFTFDSVYSYLSIRFPESSSLHPVIRQDDNVGSGFSPLNDDPIPPEELSPLITELYIGYRCAELLLRLPGNIPIPSFCVEPSLPSYLWVDPQNNTFVPHVLASLSRNVSSEILHPSVPFPSTGSIRKTLPRKVMQAPLIVRHPSPDAYEPAGRKRILNSIGIPSHLQTPRTKILVVSFGGQVFSRPQSRPISRSDSPIGVVKGNGEVSQTSSSESISSASETDNVAYPHNAHLAAAHAQGNKRDAFVHVVPPIATESHIWVPGAPPANKSPTVSEVPRFPSHGAHTDNGLLPATAAERLSDDSRSHTLIEPDQLFFPDDSWIAIVCGAANASDKGGELPRNFFLAPRDVYMPDLTALADVLLGKLGYGTTAECVDACTPFVYVPRPLFVEEHGLRRLLHDEGVGVELSREKYEAGDWADAVQEAWLAGREMKERKRVLGEDGSRRKQGMEMAHELVRWVQDWKLASAKVHDVQQEKNHKDTALAFRTRRELAF